MIERTTRVIESRLDQSIALADLCHEAGISGRTLQSVFSEPLGVSPHQYLVARRLHGIHAALRRAQPEDTVPEICSRFGAWDFGRFACSYCERLKRSPSETLAMAGAWRVPLPVRQAS